MTDEQDRRTISRLGTARALVLLASGFAVAGAAILCAVVLFVLDGVLVATLVFGLTVLVTAVAANLLAVRGRTLAGVATRGCGALLIGVIIGLAALLLLISKSA